MARYKKGFLTEKELEFLDEQSDGKSLNAIARSKGVSPMTIWKRKVRLESKSKKALDTLKILQKYGYAPEVKIER